MDDGLAVGRRARRIGSRAADGEYRGLIRKTEPGH